MDSDFILLPAQFIDDRIFVRPVTEDGTRLTFYTDTGGGRMMIRRNVATRLGLPDIASGETEESFVPFPRFKTPDYVPSGTESNELLLVPDFPWAEGFLGQPWFANRIWKLDYKNSEMGYLPKGGSYDTHGFSAENIGFQLDQQGNPGRMVLPRIQASVDGELIDFLFDTGATVDLTEQGQERFGQGDTPLRGTSFIVQTVFEKWRTRHPDWIVIEHADKQANESMIQVPTVTIAGIEVGPVWFTRRTDPNFYEFVSQWTDKQVSGALGGSLFKYFSIIIDYPNAVAYFKQ